MRTIYLATSILLFWLSFLFGKAHAQSVQTFSTNHTNGDIELSCFGHLWGISNNFTQAPDHESGFEQQDMSGEVLQYITFPNKDFKHIALSPNYLFITEPDSNKIHVYSHMGQALNDIDALDNPGSIYADGDNFVYVVERDVKKISRFSSQGQKTVICADPLLTNASALTGDDEGNLYTANRLTGQIYRWEKASQTLYPFAQIPTGTLCEDGSQISEMLFMNGKLFVASVGLCVIYMVDEVGQVTPIAGAPGVKGDIDDIGNKARFWHPNGLAASASGDTLFVSDNGKIKTITGVATAVIKDNIKKDNYIVYPNPGTDFVNITMEDAVSGNLEWKLMNSEGKLVEMGNIYSAGHTITIPFNSNPCGTYSIIILHRGNPMLQQQLILCNQ